MSPANTVTDNNTTFSKNMCSSVQIKPLVCGWRYKKCSKCGFVDCICAKK